MLKFALLLLWISLSSSGYSIEGDFIHFTYDGIAKEAVYVSGNFNQWTKDDPKWNLQFDTAAGKWALSLPKSEVKKLKGSFYEFTFRVDGQLIDADKNYKDVIHCTGYGYRYVIHGL
jgi:hypothetical protein